MNNKNQNFNCKTKRIAAVLFVFIYGALSSQTDTIFSNDRGTVACKITKVTGYNIYYTERSVGKYIEKKNVLSFSQNGVRQTMETLTAATATSVSSAKVSNKPLLFRVKQEDGFMVKGGREYERGTSFDDQTYMLAVKPGYVTRTIWLDSVKHIKNEFYDVNLTTVKGIDAKSAINKMIFTGFVDRTERVKIVEVVAAYQYTYVKLDNKDFKKLVSAKMADNGYRMINDEDEVFKQKGNTPDVAIAGEIINYEVNTRGRGLTVAVVVKWTLYDVGKQENICKVITGGYSNTGDRTPQKEVVMLALADAANGLIISPEIQKAATGKNLNTGKSKTKAITIPSVAAPVLGNNVIQSSIQSAVTIQSRHGHGSGFLVSQDGYILTNYHVIQDSVNLQAIFQNEMVLPLEIVSYNSKRDVALCKVPGRGYKAMSLDTGDVVKKIGSDVVAIGTPENIKFGQTVTKGIVSGVREFDSEVFIQTDVTINSGSSGGMLLSKEGEAIGIVVAKIKKEGTEGMGFAIPMKEALKALNIRIEKGN